MSPSSSAKDVGESVTFQCNVRGTTKSTYWMRKSSGRQIGSGNFLTLNSLRESDSDDYCCVVDVSAIQMEMTCAALSVGESKCT